MSAETISAWASKISSMRTSLFWQMPSKVAAVFRMSWWKTLLRVRIPSVMPYFLTACTTGLGFAWKSGIAAEVICRPAASIGRQLQDAKTYLETPEVFAWTAVAVILSMALERQIILAEYCGGLPER